MHIGKKFEWNPLKGSGFLHWRKEHNHHHHHKKPNTSNNASTPNWNYLFDQQSQGQGDQGNGLGRFLSQISPWLLKLAKFAI